MLFIQNIIADIIEHYSIDLPPLKLYSSQLIEIYNHQKPYLKALTLIIGNKVTVIHRALTVLKFRIFLHQIKYDKTSHLSNRD